MTAAMIPDSVNSTEPRVEIIAELAQGFEGRPEQARLLLAAAAAAGADAAKYQLVYADELASPDYKHYELFRSLEMPDEAWGELAAQAVRLGVDLQFDVFGARSLDLAVRVGAGAVKLHPTDVANEGLLEAVARSSAPRVLIGIGGTWATEIEQALRILAGKPVVLLLGFQAYPTPDDTNQIARVGQILDRARARHEHVALGFADHASPDSPLRVALAATAIGAGATVLEKHLTLGRTMKLEDHESALNPDEFHEFVQVVRACHAAVGTTSDTDDFGMSDAERTYRTTIRRHVVTARPVTRGTVLSPQDVVLKRTSANAPLTDPAAAYGRSLTRDLPANAPIGGADIE